MKSAFVKLTQAGGLGPIWIRVRLIGAIEEWNPEEGTPVVTAISWGEQIDYVSEPPEQVVEMVDRILSGSD